MQVMMRDRARLTICASVLFAIGCSEQVKSPKIGDTVPMEGIVTMDGKPLAGAVVIFHSKSSTEGFRGAQGVTDDKGKYVLQTDIGEGKTKKGVVPGRYAVTVSRMVKPDGTPLAPDVPPMSNPEAREQIPLKYSSVGDDGLSYEVPPGGGSFPIEMVSTDSTPK
jgi:hypothetical protein